MRTRMNFEPWVCGNAHRAESATHPHSSEYFVIMANRTVVLVALFAWICASAVAQDDQCPGIKYCGTFCCPGDEGAGSRCCPNEQRCCGNETTELPPAFCGSSLSRCPNSLPADEVYDGNDELRSQCCVYFRSGCCSPSENQTLDLLFKLAIGLGVGLFALLLIIGILVFCICCCVCCD